MKRSLLKVRRYALLDTDFISKTHHIQNDAGTSLADLIVKIPNFSYYCHNQIVEELGRHQQVALLPGYNEKLMKMLSCATQIK